MYLLRSLSKTATANEATTAQNDGLTTNGTATYYNRLTLATFALWHTFNRTRSNTATTDDNRTATTSRHSTTNDHGTTTAATDNGRTTANDCRSAATNYGSSCTTFAHNGRTTTNYSRATATDDNTSSTTICGGSRSYGSQFLYSFTAQCSTTGSSFGNLLRYAFETGNNEHKHLSAHTDEQHQIGSWDMCQFE